MPDQRLSISQLQQQANQLRIEAIKMLTQAGSGHTAGTLGIADIITALYFSVLNHDPSNPEWPDRDRFILSPGHTCPILYAALAYSGYLNKSDLLSYSHLDSKLQGHPSRLDLPGIEVSSGSLGQGISLAVGMALAGKINKQHYHVFCLISDGELDEGQTWEALMFAAKEKLGNLIVILDRNNIQISGTTDQVMPLEPIKDKLESFNFDVREMDGHNLEEIVASLTQAKVPVDRPVIVISHTIPGKGVSFMECKSEWHGIVPDKEQAEKRLRS